MWKTEDHSGTQLNQTHETLIRIDWIEIEKFKGKGNPCLSIILNIIKWL